MLKSLIFFVFNSVSISKLGLLVSVFYGYESPAMHHNTVLLYCNAVNHFKCSKLGGIVSAGAAGVVNTKKGAPKGAFSENVFEPGYPRRWSIGI